MKCFGILTLIETINKTYALGQEKVRLCHATMIASVNTVDTIKRYYAIGEVAQQLNVSTSMIRFWEKKFPSLQPRKNQQGTRRYTQADIGQLKKIYHLVKRKGYTLYGAKEAIKYNGSKMQGNTEDVVQMLKNIKDFLVLLKENVQQDIG